MPQFAVYRNPGRGAETPFVVQVQSSRLDGGAGRVVMPLVTSSYGAPPDQALTPHLRVAGQVVIANPLNVATIPKSRLGEPVAFLSEEDGFRIIRAVDEMISRA